MEKKGQVTIFIIIAIVIVVAAVLVYSFYPQIKSGLGIGLKNPQAFIQECIEEEIEDAVEKISLQGGSIEPEHYIFHDDQKVEYLCYTGEYSKICSIQRPLLKSHIEDEIEDEIEDDVSNCFDSLKNSYEKKGYDVILKTGVMKIELLPKRIVSIFNYSLTLTKGDTESYKSFEVILNNNLYELVAITDSIIDWEATYGDAETTVYMNYYHDLKVEKTLKSDGTKIYILTDRNRGNKFQFASRSLVLPPGYPI
jgi:hypothetical protein